MSLSADQIKYRDDTIFQLMEKNYLTLRDNEVKEANEFLKNTIEKDIIELMREDELFDLLFQRITYGGSFYKGTRFGKPEEFDLLLVIKLPFSYDYLEIDTRHTNYGYVKIEVDVRALNTPTWLKHKNELSKWIIKDNYSTRYSNTYLDHNKFHSWAEKVITTAVSKLDDCSRYCSTSTHTHIQHRKTGPAFTLHCENARRKIKMDIDLVPALEFDNVPLGNGYKTINGTKKTWMAVAKPMSTDVFHGNLLWRLCFYEQEKEFLQGELKPVIKMLKKFRDTMEWKGIASYFLETLVYNDLENHQNSLDNFLRSSKTCLFINALRRLKYALENQSLPYFWHKNYNLLDKLSYAEIYNYSNRLNKIIRLIDSNSENQGCLILAEAILERHEADQFKEDYARDKLSRFRF